MRVFVDKGVAAPESGHFALIVIDADDIVAHFGETNSSDKANIS